MIQDPMANDKDLINGGHGRVRKPMRTRYCICVNHAKILR